MQSKLKTVEKIITPDHESEMGQLRESTKKAQHTMSVLRSDNARLKGLLEEAVAQLSKTNDEYHSELGDKIRVELGMVKEMNVQAAPD